MALSNWAHLAFGPKGEENDGTIPFKYGTVELYKNWLHIHSEKLWEKESRYQRNIIGEIHNSFLILFDCDIYAIRGRQSSIFYLIINEKAECYCGIGCYGFMDYLTYIEKNHPSVFASIPQQIKNDKEIIEGNSNGKITFWTSEMQEYHTEVKCPSLKKIWIGIEPETWQEFLKWISELRKEEDIDESYIDLIAKAVPRFFNPGDVFFGVDSKTEVGQKGEAPILFSKLI